MSRSSPPRVAILVAATDRTGAPTVLLHLLRHLTATTDWSFDLVVLRKGELHDEFAALGTVHVLGEPDLGPYGDDAARTAAEADDRTRRALLAGLTDLDLVYVNTAWSIHALRYLPEQQGRPVLAAIHELDMDLGDSMPAASLAELFGRPDAFIAGAAVIGRALVARYGVDPADVVVIDESIPLPDPGAPGPDRQELGLSPEAFVVIGAGSPQWRKGIDLFVHVAAAVRRRRPTLALTFRWLGADPEVGHPDLVTPLADRDRLGLADVVELLPPTDRVIDHMRRADVFLLTSREDAQPLVALEAAAMALPVVCFDNGGIPDALGSDACTTVAYPDIGAMADALIELADAPAERRAKGHAGRARVVMGHDIATNGDRIRAEIERWLA